jgi:ABC-type bacteriocin/lantibiotic exporter with double-glycine peptidase domain
MRKSQQVAVSGFFFAILGIIFYVLYKFIPIFFIQAISAFCLALAVWNIFGSICESKKENTAIKRFKQFEQLKKELTEKAKGNFHARNDGKAENKKSEDDANS